MFRRRSVSPTLVLGAALALLAGTARAQTITSYQGPVVAPVPYYGYAYGPYYARPAAAEIMDSYGRFLINKQEASRLEQYVKQEKLVTRRKTMEQWAWELEFTSKVWEDWRKRAKEDQIRRAVEDPDFTVIANASVLNDILRELKKLPAPNSGTSPLIDPEALAHLQYTSEGTASIGLLRGERLFWPLALTSREFAEEKKSIEQLLGRLKTQANTGQPNPDDLRELRKVMEAMRDHLVCCAKDPACEFSNGQLIQAKNFVNRVHAALLGVENNPDIAFYFRPLQAKTVSDLVQHFRGKGLVFSPANPGDERYYIALHRQMAEELQALRGTKP